MNFQQLLTAVRNAYRNAPNPSQPISHTNYLAMLYAFSALVSRVSVSSAYDYDFRRNLPGGGLSGFKVVPLTQCITDAETFAKNNPVFPLAGEGIAENIRAILDLLTPDVAQGVLAPYFGSFQNILEGNL